MPPPSKPGKRRGNNPPASQSSRVQWALSARQTTVVFLCVSVLTAFFLQFSSDRIADPDILYHFRHAEIYGRAGAAGLFAADFPWVRYSVISEYASDLWYGFHLLLVPFTWAEDPILGLRLAGVFTTALFLFLIYAAYSRLELRPAAFWPFFLLFSSAFVLHRLAMLRPHALSLGLHVLLFAFLAVGNIWGVFVVALASTFLHLSLFVVSFFIFGIFAAIKLISEKALPWRSIRADRRSFSPIEPPGTAFSRKNRQVISEIVPSSN